LKSASDFYLFILQAEFSQVFCWQGGVFGLLRGHNGLNVQFVVTPIMPGKIG